MRKSAVIFILIFCVSFSGCKNNNVRLSNFGNDSFHEISSTEDNHNSNSSDFTVSHTHKFLSATCTQPKICACGETSGKALGHDYFGIACALCGEKDPTPPIITFGNIGIIGDSYSAYRGYISMGNNTWYAVNGNGNNESANDINDVSQTWWYSLIEETNSRLILNESSSGSSIAYYGWAGIGSKDTSFVTRAIRSFSGEFKPEIDTFFIFGGLNDLWAGTSLGSVKYGDWTDTDFEKTLPAFGYLINTLKTNYPNACIINIAANLLSDDMKKGMQETCEHYGADNIILTDIVTDNGHPNIAGMKQIKNQILDFYCNN